MPNQHSQTVRKQISSWFGGDNFGPKSPNLIYSTTALYDLGFTVLGVYPNKGNAGNGVMRKEYKQWNQHTSLHTV